MRSNKIPYPDKTIAQQVQDLKKKHPNFKLTYSPSTIIVHGEIRPSARSVVYDFKIKFRLRHSPEVSIISPKLVKNFLGDDIPHTYPGNRLCLYYPKYNEFKFTDLLSSTIIPWTSLWLYYYEVWHTTGKWRGGGIHPLVGT